MNQKSLLTIAIPLLLMIPLNVTGVTVEVTCDELPTYDPVICPGGIFEDFEGVRTFTLKVTDAIATTDVMTWTVSVRGEPILTLDAQANEFVEANRVGDGRTDTVSSVEGYLDQYTENGNCFYSAVTGSHFGSFTFMGVTFPTSDCGWDVKACDGCAIVVKVGEESVLDCYANTGWSATVETIDKDSKLYHSIKRHIPAGADISEVKVESSNPKWMDATCSILVT
jgi:hypothetical protein